MSLLDLIRQAEEQGRKSVRHGVDRAEELWEDAQRRIRRKWRIHPRRQAVDAAPENPPSAKKHTA